MQRDYDFFVYVLSSRSRNLYVGITNGLLGRLSIHRERRPGTHTAKSPTIDRLVYYEHFQYVLNAIAREKQLKHWTRAQKIALIESVNPTWQDLSLKWNLVDPSLAAKGKGNSGFPCRMTNKATSCRFLRVNDKAE